MMPNVLPNVDYMFTQGTYGQSNVTRLACSSYVHPYGYVCICCSEVH